MLPRVKLFLSVNALALAALQCGGSTPASNTPSAESSNGSSGNGTTGSSDAQGTQMGTSGEASSGATNRNTASGSSGSSSDNATGTTTAGAAASGPSSSSGSDMSSAALSDEQIGAITEKANTAEIDQAKLAQSKATDERVRSFAAMMIAHHGQAKQKQASLKLTTEESPQSRQLAQEASATLQTLQDKSGRDFDRAYIEAQVEAHKRVLETLNRELLPNAKNPQLKAYLQTIKPTIEQHLAQAQQYQQALQSSSSGSSSSGRSAQAGQGKSNH
jgi:putative membrane protein